MKPITIIGGGLAGLSLGIRLRRRDVAVTIVEAGAYPRHRVCGEFICGQGVKALTALEVPGLGESTNVTPGRDAAFFVGTRLIAKHVLPAPALCVSRHVLDGALARYFAAIGGELRMGERRFEAASTGEVQAAGRRAQPADGEWKWFGLKVHARNVSLCADLEMHLSANSYVGLCRLANGKVNVCGLFRRHIEKNPDGDPIAQLRGIPGTELCRRLRHAEFDRQSFCAVAGLSLKPRQPSSAECCVGDALSMIPPITGNGMSIAFESAELAAGSLTAYAREEQTWHGALNRIAALHRERFSARLQRASFLHRLIFSKVGPPLLGLVFRLTPLWRISFAATR